MYKPEVEVLCDRGNKASVELLLLFDGIVCV